jgi:hypothetical protein
LLTETDIGQINKMLHNEYNDSHHNSDQKRKSDIEKSNKSNHNKADDTDASEIGSAKMRRGNKGCKTQNCPKD